MEAILINRKLSDKEEADILDELSSGKDYEIYSNVEVSAQLSTHIKGSFELTPEEKKKINYETFDRVLKFGEIKVNGKAITDLLMVEKASIWHYHKFRTYFYIRNLFFEIRLIEKMQIKFENVTCFGENKDIQNYSFQLPAPTIITSIASSQKINYLSLVTYSIFFLYRVIRGSMFLKLKKRKHLIIDHAMKQSVINIENLKVGEGNCYLDYLIEKADDNFAILDDVEIPKFTGKSFKFIRSHKVKNRIYGESILFTGLQSSKMRSEWKKACDKLTLVYELLKEAELREEEKFIIRFLVSLHKTSKLYLFKYFSYKHFFRKSKFRSVTSIDENSMRIKSILDAAKSNNIKSIGVQHGTIHDLHPAYVFTREDAERGIHQDHTVVWGNHWAEFLIIKGNYPAESIITTGQIRTDIIPGLKNVNRQDYFELADDKKLIMFASQPQRDSVLREKAAFDVFTSVKDLENVELVLKLHPAEKDDFDYYRNIAKKAACNNFRIVLEFDLYLLISISDIVITCFSTVGAETVYFNKPLIILDHLKQDIQRYHEEGIAFQTTNDKELNEVIIPLLSGELKLDKKAYQEYIQKYALSIDGKVSERVLDFIRSF